MSNQRKFGELLIASNNAHKTGEIEKILAGVSRDCKVYTLKDKNIDIEVEEDADTLEGNALKKAKEIFKVAQMPVIADDTGLFVEALDGKPGVYSARYAGEDASYSDNCSKLISELKSLGLDESPAYFKTIICLYVLDNKHHFFEGVCKGMIITEVRGENGFGYDPLFVPEEYDLTFAELPPDKKNNVSHRGRALEKFNNFLTTKTQSS